MTTAHSCGIELYLGGKSYVTNRCDLGDFGFHNSGNNTDTGDGNTCENVDIVLVESPDGIDRNRNSFANVSQGD